MCAYLFSTTKPLSLWIMVIINKDASWAPSIRIMVITKDASWAPSIILHKRDRGSYKKEYENIILFLFANIMRVFSDPVQVVECVCIFISTSISSGDQYVMLHSKIG
jgi:hypothetical protein